VRNISSPGIALRVCLIFAITGASGLRTWVKGSIAQVLPSEFYQFITEEFGITEDPLEA